MFGIGSTELVIILIVALVLIGPSKLPDLMKSVGKGIAEFRRMSTDVRSTIEREIERADEAKRVEETKKELFGDEAKPEAAAKAETAAGDAPVAQAETVSDTALAEAAASPAGDARKAEEAAASVTGSAQAASSEKAGEAAKAEKPADEAVKPQVKSHA